MTILSSGQDIYIRKGDTGQVAFSGIPKDKDYSVFMSIYNPDNEQIIKELQATTFTQATGVALFQFNETTSNNLPVGEWTYGLKICADGSEDTVLPHSYVNEDGELINETAPKFTVDYKYIEGE